MDQDKGTSQERIEALRAREYPAVKTTIVGGRPPGAGKTLGSIPRGIEVLIKKASVDADFKATLLACRSRAADLITLRLEPSEAAMLDLVPAQQLEAIIARTRVAPEKRRAFLGKAAAVMLVALGASNDGGKAQVPVAGVAAPPITQPPAEPVAEPTPRSIYEPVFGPSTQPVLELVDEVPFVNMIAGVMPQPPLPVRRPATWPAALTTQQATDLPRLIKQLDGDSTAEREEANRKIREMGPAVIAPIEDALNSALLGQEAVSRLQAIAKTARASTQPAQPVSFAPYAALHHPVACFGTSPDVPPPPDEP